MRSINCKKRKYSLCLVLVCALLLWSNGCSIEKANRTKVRDLDYQIVVTEEIPEELMVQIEEKKAADFKLSFETPDSVYIVRGYGEQATGGYSICVRELYLSTNAVFFSTELIGPRKGETVNKSPSFPYIVIKTERTEKNVVFE